MNARVPSFLASHDSPAAQRLLAKHLAERTDYDPQASEIAQTREIVRLIRALPVWAKTPAAYGHLCAALSAEVSLSGWGHSQAGEIAQQLLDEAHDVLGKAAEVQR
jgi:hypothetical protein